ncbi:MAG: methylenetetrahydrofolate reductase C-terminal domain-containing protein [Anaerolineales bacterium]
MGIARWMQNYPHLLERAFQLNNWIFKRLKPVMQRLGFERVDHWLRLPEELSKKEIFDCRMCGQCVLHSTGMTCPMTCPKLLRNGPCGGVRPRGFCEVYPDRRCIWHQAYQRSQRMHIYGDDMLLVQPAVARLNDFSVNRRINRRRPTVRLIYAYSPDEQLYQGR